MAQPKNEYLPLTQMQRGVFVDASTADGDDPYVIQVMVDFADVLDGERFSRAADAVTAAHPALRACFRTRASGEPVQIVLPAVHVPGTRDDLRDSAPEGVTQRLEALRREDSATAFDLAQAPLMRYRIVDLPGGGSHLLFSFHHLVVDGWSVSVVFRDLLAAYAGADLTPEFTFRDYLGWETQVDPAPAHEAFARVMAGFTGPSSIAQHLLDGEPGERVVAIQLPAEATARLSEWCRGREISLASVVEVCWAQSVALQTGSTDVVIGVMEANRSFAAAGIAAAVGLFANVVPVRVVLDGDASVAQVCERVARQRLDTLAHRHLSLGRIQAAYGADPLLDTIVTFQNYRSEDVGDGSGDGSAARIVAARSHTPTTQPAMLAVIPGRALRVELSYRTAAVSPRHARALLDVFGHLLAGVPGCADLAVRDWPLHPSGPVPSAASRQAPREASEAASDPAAGESLLPALLLAAAGRHGDRPALSTPAGTTSYRELYAEAVALACWLRDEHGADEGEAVAVTAAQEHLAVVARLAALLAGTVLCPVDPTVAGHDVLGPAADVRLVLADAAGAPGGPGARTVLLDAPAVEDAIRRHRHRAAPALRTRAGDDAVRVPHRVRARRYPVTHGALAAALTGYADRIAVTPGDTVETTSPGSPLVLASLLRGAHVVLGAGEERRVPAPSGGVRVATVREGSASALGRAVRRDPGAFGGCRVVVSRPPLTRSTVDALREAGAQVWLAYAPGGVPACLSPVQEAEPVPAIGGPLADVRLQVLDPHGRSVPRGGVGEIVVVADEVRRTGQLGRHEDSGRTTYLGPLDQPFHLRGHRIEPWVVEEALTAAPGVEEAAVVLVEGAQGPSLVAHVAPATLDAGAVAASVRGRLPRYATPTRIVTWPHLPRGTAGDVDHDELARQLEEGEVSPADVARLVALFAEVTGAEDVAAHDDFFALGGDSIGVTRLRALAASRHGWDLDLRLVLDLRTPVAIVRELAGTRTAAARGPQPSPDEEDPLPRRAAQDRREGALVGTQASLWLLNRLDPESSGYNLTLALDLEGDVDEAALVAAVDDVAGRHEVLRTRYGLRDGLPVQRVEPLPAGRALLTVVDTPADALDRVLAKSAGQGFRLDEELPLRAELHKVAPGRATMLLTFHHVAIDGTSFLPLAHDLTLAYTARARGEAPRFATPPVQYLDYAAWFARRLGDTDQPGTRAARQAEFWRRHLKGLAESTGVPPDSVGGPGGEGHPATRLLLDWGPEVTEAVTRIARQAGSTRFAVYQAATAAAMHSLGAPVEIALGAPVSVRPHVNLEDAIGNYSNFVVSRVQLDPNESLVSNSARRGLALAEELDHQELPFNEVVRAVNAPRRPGRNPLYQTVLALQSFDKPTAQLDGVVVTERLMPVVDARVDLVVAVVEGAPEEGVTLSAEFTERAYRPQTVAAIVERLREVLIGGAADPDRPLSLQLHGIGGSATAVPTSTGATQAVAAPVPAAAAPAAVAPGVGAHASPVDALLAEVVAAYGTAIRFTEVDPDAGYFDAGGDSIGTVTVAAALAAHHVDIATLMTGPSARELAARIAGGEFGNATGREPAGFAGVAAAGYDVDLLDPFATLLPIRPTGGGRPLFVFHGGVGLAIPYTGLSSVIDSEIPVYGLQSTETIFGGTAAGTLSEQAQQYLVRIRAVQPQGPYRLLGWSYGGWVAHETARLIEQDGGEVELLVVIDSEVPLGSERSWGPELPREAVVRAFTSVLGITEEDGSDITTAERLHAAFQRTDGAFAQLTPGEVSSFVDVIQGHARLARSHRPGTVNAPTVLFWSSSRGTRHPCDLSDGWAPFLAGPVSSVSVEAQHQYLMHPLPQRLIGTAVNALLHDAGRAQLRREPRYREEIDILDYLAELPTAEEDTPPGAGQEARHGGDDGGLVTGHEVRTAPSTQEEPGSPSRFAHLRGVAIEASTLIGRRLQHLRQTPWRLISVALNPLILIVALGYLFARAIVIPGYQGQYMSYLLAGVAAQAGLQNIGPTAVAIRADLDKGLFDRFRSLPTGRGVVLFAHSVADFVIGAAGMLIVVVGGFLAGWRLGTNPAGLGLGLLVLLLFTYTCVWLGIGVGLLVKNLESIESIGVTLSVGLSFLSNALLAPGTLPKWLQPFAEWNPVSAVATSVRQAWGNPTATSTSIAGDYPLLVVGVFCGLVLLVVPALAQRRYRKTA